MKSTSRRQVCLVRWIVVSNGYSSSYIYCDAVVLEIMLQYSITQCYSLPVLV